MERLEDVVKAHILAILESSGGNISVAARRLGIQRSTLQRRLRGFGIRPQPSHGAGAARPVA